MYDPPPRRTTAAPPSRRLRLLCVHGWRSNDAVTRVQLGNVGLAGAGNELASLVVTECLHAPLRSTGDEPYDASLGAVCPPPYWSWCDGVGRDTVSFHNSLEG